MSSKRQASELGGIPSVNHNDRPHKAARLDTADNSYITESHQVEAEDFQDLFGDTAMQDLLGGLDDIGIADEPPTSILRDFQSDVSNMEMFDPTLSFSPVKEDEDTDEFLLNDEPRTAEDVDWAGVFELDELLSHHRDISAGSFDASPPEQSSSDRQNSSPSSAWTSSVTMGMSTPDLSDMRLKQLKTFFRLSEMIESKMSLFRHSQDTVFELFARVAYSSRENFGHQQYFQFRDLFEETPPFLTGVLSG